MVRNKEKFQQAVVLRKRGFTLEEIAKYCDIAKSTASAWLKNESFSKRISVTNKRRAGQENAKRLKMLAKGRQRERLLRYKNAETSAVTEFKNYQNNSLFMAGLNIYLTSGDFSEQQPIRITHKNPAVHRIFIKFIDQYMGIDKSNIKFWLLLYQGMSEESSMKKWSKQTSLPYSQFYKNQFITNQSTKTLHYGVGNTIIASTHHKRKLQVWVNLLQKEW
jgi:transcriptional regulator with XRE-family HTH domain